MARWFLFLIADWNRKSNRIAREQVVQTALRARKRGIKVRARDVQSPAAECKHCDSHVAAAASVNSASVSALRNSASNRERRTLVSSRAPTLKLHTALRRPPLHWWPPSRSPTAVSVSARRFLTAH